MNTNTILWRDMLIKTLNIANYMLLTGQCSFIWKICYCKDLTNSTSWSWKCLCWKRLLSSYPLFDTARYFYLTRQDINPRAPRIFTKNTAFKNRGIDWSDEIRSYQTWWIDSVRQQSCRMSTISRIYTCKILAKNWRISRCE